MKPYTWLKQDTTPQVQENFSSLTLGEVSDTFSEVFIQSDTCRNLRRGMWYWKSKILLLCYELGKFSYTSSEVCQNYR